MSLCPVQLTKDLIACASVTPVDAGAQMVVGKALQAMGFVCHPLLFGEVPNLFARLGDRGPHVCYAGHTDVVPAGPLEAWTSAPFTPTVRDGVLYGRGASDMKGSVACFIAAISLFLEKHGKPSKGSISMLITGDEEGPAVDGTVRVLEWMERQGHVPDVALVGEPSNTEYLGQEIKIGRRGSLTGYITVTGRQGHVAYPDRCDNPVPRLVRLLSALTMRPLDAGHESFQPSNLEIVGVEAGVGVDNVIPAQAKAIFNVRFNIHWSGQSLIAHVREILNDVGEAYTLTTSIGAEPFLTERGVWSNLVADATADVTGARPAMTTMGGTSDARFIHRYCPVVECGGINASIHQANENARIADLEGLTQIYLRILERYFY